MSFNLILKGINLPLTLGFINFEFYYCYGSNNWFKIKLMLFWHSIWLYLNNFMSWLVIILFYVYSYDILIMH